MFDPIDYNRVFARLPEITGMELNQRGTWWEGKYYITGEPHPYKRDKLKARLYGGTVRLYEQGGESMTLATWLVKYGGCADYKAAFDVIRGGDKPVSEIIRTHRHKTEKHVPMCDVDAMRGFDVENDNLFRWMSGMFGADRVRAVWERYNTMTDGRSTVFWYVNAEGKVLHDKRIRYDADGHRDRNFGCTRKYKTADGYTGRCLFGEHLIEGADVLNFCESEKSVLLCACMWGDRKGLWVSSGGKGNLKTLIRGMEGKRIRLFPDMDAFEEWGNLGYEVVDWFRGQDMGEKDDVGDLVVKLKSKKI